MHCETTARGSSVKTLIANVENYTNQKVNLMEKDVRRSYIFFEVMSKHVLPVGIIPMF